MNVDVLLQEHKRFLIGAGLGLIFFLVAKGVLESGPDGRKTSATSNLRVSRSALQGQHADRNSVAQARVRLGELNDLVVRLAASTLPPLPQEYRPAFGVTPARHYLEFTSARREEIVTLALLRDVQIDESLGLPPVSPTQPQVQERALRGFFVVEKVVRLSVAHGAQSIEDLRIGTRLSARRAKGGVEGVLSTTPVEMTVALADAQLAPFVSALVDHDPPLGLIRLAVLPLSRDGLRRVVLECGVGAPPLSPSEEDLP